jgi:hypothetical protein
MEEAGYLLHGYEDKADAGAVLSELGAEPEIEFSEELYLSSQGEMLDLVCSVSDTVESVLLQPGDGDAGCYALRRGPVRERSPVGKTS